MRMARPTPVGARYSPKASRSVQPHSPVVTPALAQAIDGGMMLRARGRRALEFGERVGHGACLSRAARQALSRSSWSRSASSETVMIEFDAAGERRGLGLEIFVDADHDLLAALDRFQPRGVRFDELLLHVAGLDRGDRAAHLVDALELFLRLAS